MKLSTGTSQPTSVTVKPAAQSIEQTMVLPISWMSPATVPATATPRVRAALLGRVEGGLQDGHRGLHGLGPLDQLGQEELAAAEEVADLLDALDEALVEDVDGGQAGVEALLRPARRPPRARRRGRSASSARRDQLTLQPPRNDSVRDPANALLSPPARQHPGGSPGAHEGPAAEVRAKRLQNDCGGGKRRGAPEPAAARWGCALRNKA